MNTNLARDRIRLLLSRRSQTFTDLAENESEIRQTLFEAGLALLLITGRRTSPGTIATDPDDRWVLLPADLSLTAVAYLQGWRGISRVLPWDGANLPPDLVLNLP